MARRTPRALCSFQRDAVTGEPLVPGTLRLRLPPDADVRPRPVILHRSVTEGHLGGKCYSVDFQRYLRHVRPTSLVAAERAWRSWWGHAWAEGELYAAFPPDAVWAVLQWRRDGADMQYLASVVDHTVTWIAVFERRMAAHIRALLPTYLSRPGA